MGFLEHLYKGRKMVDDYLFHGKDRFCQYMGERGEYADGAYRMGYWPLCVSSLRTSLGALLRYSSFPPPQKKRNHHLCTGSELHPGVQHTNGLPKQAAHLEHAVNVNVSFGVIFILQLTHFAFSHRKNVLSLGHSDLIHAVSGSTLTEVSGLCWTRVWGWVPSKGLPQPVNKTQKMHFRQHV